jgi:hypothetical protein
VVSVHLDILIAVSMRNIRFDSTLLLRTLTFISVCHQPDSRYLIQSELVITEMYRVK